MDRATTIAFFFVATTSLLPSNLFQNAHEYFYYKLRNISNTPNITLWDNSSHEEQTYFQHVFEGYVTFCGGILNIIGTFANVWATSKISNATRVLLGHAICIAAFIPTFVLSYINTDEWQEHFFWLSMAFSGLSAFGSIGLICGGITGLAVMYPESSMKAVMFGQAAAGVISAGLSILCQAFASNDLVNGRIYFAIATVWIILSIFAYLYLLRDKSRNYDLHRSNSSLNQSLLDNDDEEDIREQMPSLVLVRSPSFADAWRDVFDIVGTELISTALVIGVTLSAFPAITSLVVTNSPSKTWQKYYSAVFCFLVFNLGDVIGRFVGGFLSLDRQFVCWASVARIVFPALFFFCEIAPRRNPGFSFFHYDYIFLLFMVLFGVSNGVLLTSASVGLNRFVPDQLKEVSGSILALMGASAALAGALIGVVLVGLI